MRSLIRLCVSRPVSVGAVCAFVVALSVAALLRLPVTLLPDLGYPALTVWTAYPDVPPERVEEGVTAPVEEAVAGTEGLQQVTARSQLGGSLVELQFGWGADLDRALLDAREQLDQLGDRLPEGAERPVVLRVDPSERPIMMLALREAEEGRDPPLLGAGGPDNPADRQDLVRLRETGEEVVARRLEQLSDVARVRVAGGHEPRVSVTLDESRMAALGLSVGDITTALERANVALPGGTIQRGPFRYAVEVSGEYETPEDVAATVVDRSGDLPIRLSDVADVRPDVEERRGLVRLDGQEALLLLVERSPDANTVRAAEEVRGALSQLEAELPQVALDVVVDESTFIEEAIGGVQQAVLFGGLLAILVLLAFLRRPRVLLAVAVAVPLSVGLTIVLFDLMGVTFNLIALSGLALGVGLLVDNAIVVVENIARLREEGQGPFEAAIEGTGEVAGAITASTLTTIAVFLPITFIEGLAGRLFQDQSLAVVASLLASLVVALLVVPVIISREPEDAGPIGRPELMRRLLARYEGGLQWSLNRPGWILAGAAVALIGASALAWMLPREVVPDADQGRVEAQITLASDADLPLVSERAATVERAAREAGLADQILADLGERREARLELDPRPPYEGDLTITLDGAVSAEEATDALRALELPGDMEIEARPTRTQLEELIAPDEAALLIDLVAEDRRDAEPAAAPLLEDLQERPEFAGVRRAAVQDVPGYELRFDRGALARYGVSPTEVGGYLEASARGQRATELREVGEEVPIVVRAPRAASIEELLERRIPTPGGLMPLSRFVEAEAVTLPAALVRSGQAPVVRLEADIASGYDLAAATAAIDDVVEGALPPGVRSEVGGSAEAFRDSLTAVGWSLLLSLLLVYLILTAQFERLLQPFIILAAVPLAAAGVAVVLGLTGQSVNLMSLTGCVVLVGIVVNDAIIKVDFINQRRERGMGLRAAILDAGKARVRPILMTTVTTALGLLPLAVGLGAGAELRAPLAIAIVGGILSATVLTLFVVPVLYQGIARTRMDQA